MLVMLELSPMLGGVCGEGENSCVQSRRADGDRERRRKALRHKGLWIGAGSVELRHFAFVTARNSKIVQDFRRVGVLANSAAGAPRDALRSQTKTLYFEST
jgi:hypothetical protein